MKAHTPENAEVRKQQAQDAPIAMRDYHQEASRKLANMERLRGLRLAKDAAPVPASGNRDEG